MAAITDHMQPFNVVVAIHMSPFPPAADIRAALETLQQKHPALRARISAEGELQFVCDVERQLPFEERVLPDPIEWAPVVEGCLNARIDSGTGPLLRCLALRTETSSSGVLIAACHHSIVDAASLESFINDLLTLIGGGRLAQETAPSMPDIEGRFPPPFRGLRRALPLSGFLLRQLRQELGMRLRRSGTASFPVRDETVCRIFPFSLGAAETERLIRAARRHGVTLNTVVNAALALAFCRAHESEPDLPVRMVSFADLRPYLDPPLQPQSLGAAIAMLRVTMQRRPGDSLWDFSLRLQAAFSEAFRRGDKFSGYLLMEHIIRPMIRINRFRMGDSAVSYTGQLDLPHDFGRYHLTGFNAFISNNRLGPVLSAQARLFRDLLWVDGLYMDGDMDADEAEDAFGMVRDLLVNETVLES